MFINMAGQNCLSSNPKLYVLFKLEHPQPVGTQSALGPQGFGLHGSGFSLHPVMVSGAGM